MANEPNKHGVAAIVAAGGIGSRFSQSGPKQRQILQGYPLYQWCLASLLNHEKVDSTVLVAHRKIIEELSEEIQACPELEAAARDKLVLVPGGKSRQESVYLGLKELEGREFPPAIVMVHDAARPFLTRELIDRTIASIEEFGACTVASPVADTIKRAKSGTIIDTVDRSDLFAAHTPQGARFDWMLQAHEQARRDGYDATDDASVLENAGRRVKIVDSHRLNIKVTVPDDLAICEAISYMFIGQINGCLS